MTEEDQFRKELYRVFPLAKGARCTGSGTALSTMTRDYSFEKDGTFYVVEREESGDMRIWTYPARGKQGRIIVKKAAKRSARKVRRKAR